MLKERQEFLSCQYFHSVGNSIIDYNFFVDIQ